MRTRYVIAAAATPNAGGAGQCSGSKETYLPSRTPQQQLPSTGRIEWVDTYKGIGIAAIVLGHVIHPGAAHRLLYLFHVPLFFFISGFLYRPVPSFGRQLRRRTIRLLLPYLAFLLSFAPFMLLIGARHGTSYSQTMMNLLWGGSRLASCCTTFWFITCLFLTELVGMLAVSTVGASLLPVIGLASLLLAYTTRLLWPWLSLPLDANVVAAALPLFLIGYLFRRHHRPWLAVVSIPGALAAILLIAYYPNMTMDMKEGHYGVPFLSLFLALCCIHTTILISRALCGLGHLRLLGSLGRSSLGIMFIHPFLLANRLSVQLDQYSAALSFCVVLAGSFLASQLLESMKLTRITFLGMEDPTPSHLVARGCHTGRVVATPSRLVPPKESL